MPLGFSILEASPDRIVRPERLRRLLRIDHAPTLVRWSHPQSGRKTEVQNACNYRSPPPPSACPDTLPRSAPPRQRPEPASVCRSPCGANRRSGYAGGDGQHSSESISWKIRNKRPTLALSAGMGSRRTFMTGPQEFSRRRMLTIAAGVTGTSIGAAMIGTPTPAPAATKVAQTVVKYQGHAEGGSALRKLPAF